MSRASSWIARLAVILGGVAIAVAALAYFYLGTYESAPVDPAPSTRR